MKVSVAAAEFFLRKMLGTRYRLVGTG